VLFATVLASAMAFINQSAVNVALPAIQSALKADGRQLLWVVNSNTLLLASVMLAGGSLGDRLGRKRVFMAGICLFTLASLACGAAPSTGFLIASRAVQGAGGGLMIPGSLALITANFPLERRGRAIGTWAAATTITMVAGPLIGGFLADAGLWRVVFLINLPLALLCLMALHLRVPESQDRQISRRIDLPGALLAALGMAGLIQGFTAATDWGFGNLRSFLPLSAGLAALAGFVVAELRSRDPLIPLDLFKSRTFSGANLLTLFLYGALSAYTLFFNLNLIQAQGYRASLAGLAFVPVVALLAGISRWSGRLVEKTGARLPLVLGPSIVAAGFLAHSFIGLTQGPRDYWTTFLPASALFGIGMGFTVAPLSTTVMNAVDEQFAGRASGINNAVSRIAGVLTVAVFGSIALLSFQSAVDGRAAEIGLPQAARAELQAEAQKLGEAEVPASVPSAEKGQVEQALTLAFVHAFHVVMILCAALAVLGAVSAAVLLDRDHAKIHGQRYDSR
jgi:EmrB/QacA subfamily drug resistance transporter